MVTKTISHAPKIAHESEVQRQHIRIGLSAAAAINKKKYRVHDLSSGGFSIEAPDNIFAAETQNVKLLFSFENFSFHLDAKARPIHYSNGRAGFAFTELNARQVSLLSYIIKSYLSGLIISEGDIINVATRNDFTKMRENIKSNDNAYKNWVSKILPFAFVLLVGIAGFFFLLANLYENTLIIKSHFGIVEGATYSVRAEKDGIYHSLLAEGARKVVKDQPLAIIKDTAATPASPGQDMILKSPCDCIVISRASKDGEFRALGEPLFELVPVDAKPWITANLNPEQTQRLKLQDSVKFRLVGEGKFFDGHITEFLSPSFNRPFVQIKIKPVQALPVDAVGRQAYAEVSVY